MTSKSEKSKTSKSKILNKTEKYEKINKSEKSQLTIKTKYPFYKYQVKFSKTEFRKSAKDSNVSINNNIIKSDWNTDQYLNGITDLFTESVRIKCHFKNNISPLEFWTKNKKALLSKTSDIEKIRELIYKGTKSCTNFSISNALAILKRFKPKSWLDISAGWGDRLVSAIAFGIERYVAVDPNIELHSGYAKIIRALDNKNASKYTLIKSGFETAVLPNEKFDIVFSSPPYFDLEIYSKNPDDSVMKNSNFESWYKNFLLISVKKSLRYVNKGGYIILHIPKSYGLKLTKDIPEMKYQYSVYIEKNGFIIPSMEYFVWRV